MLCRILLYFLSFFCPVAGVRGSIQWPTNFPTSKEQIWWPDLEGHSRTSNDVWLIHDSLNQLLAHGQPLIPVSIYPYSFCKMKIHGRNLTLQFFSCPWDTPGSPWAFWFLWLAFLCPMPHTPSLPDYLFHMTVADVCLYITQPQSLRNSNFSTFHKAILTAFVKCSKFCLRAFPHSLLINILLVHKYPPFDFVWIIVSLELPCPI